MDSVTRRSRRGRSFAETRSAVLDLIRSGGEVTRVELARQAALTEATISKIVKDLLADGVIVEAGHARSTGGKRATLLRLAHSTRWAIGVILDHARIVVVLCTLDGSRVASFELPGIGVGEAEAVLHRVAAGVADLLGERKISSDAVIGIGVAVAGRRHDHVDLSTTPPDGWWERIAVNERLEELTGLSVLVENDANCAALGEFWSGRVPDDRDFIVVYMADGIGSGIVIDGDVYRGRSGHAGEIGHVFVDPARTPCWCGSLGCLQMVAAPEAIARRACASPAIRKELKISKADSLRTAYGKIGRQADNGNAVAQRLLADAAEFLAVAVVGLVNTFDLDRVVLAGPGFAAAPTTYETAIRAAVNSTYVRTLHPVEVELRSVDQDIAALGAASLILHRRLTPHHTAS